LIKYLFILFFNKEEEKRNMHANDSSDPTLYSEKDVSKPVGSNAMALTYLKLLQECQAENEFIIRAALNDQYDLSSPKPVLTPAEIKQAREQRIATIRDETFEKWVEEQRVHAASKKNSKEQDSIDTEKIAELTKPLDSVPIISLGTTVNQTSKNGGFRSEIEEEQTKIMQSYPEIVVRKIRNIDVYLHAYNKFLKKWVPELEFNYTDPGKIEGHLEQLRNAIKLAFSDQYQTVRKAYLGVRSQIFSDLQVSESVETGTLKLYHRVLEENKLTPDKFNEMIDNVFSTLKEKQILNINDDASGQGYFLLWLDPETKGLYALPTLGTFGSFLPEPGFSLVKEFGWQYFRNTAIIGFQVGHLRKILIENSTGDWEDWNLTEPIYLEISESEYDDNSISRIQIDGHFFEGTIYSSI
jgi:hypothetical protein